MTGSFDDRLDRARSSVDAERERVTAAQQRVLAEREEAARQARERAGMVRGEFTAAIYQLVRAPRGERSRRAREFADRSVSIKRGELFSLDLRDDTQLEWWVRRDRFSPAEFCGWEAYTGQERMHVAPDGGVLFWSGGNGRSYLQAKAFDRRARYKSLEVSTLEDLIRRGGYNARSRTDYGWADSGFVGVDVTIASMLDKIAETVVRAEE
jgi:hypothetical protein